MVTGGARTCGGPPRGNEGALATTVRRAVLNLPAAPLGPENPLPPLRTPAPPPALDPRERAGLPRDMARQLGHRPLRTVLPTRLLDGYGRERTPTDIDAVVIENARLRVTVLPGLGGRIHSLHHKPTGRELLHRNPVLQPAAFALNGAWFSGGIEWNIGATGHTALSCAPLHAALVPAPDGSTMVRLWEWERLRDLPFQVDLWLPDDSDFLHVGVRIRNPHEQPAPVYWWSNIAVPETPDTRVLVPADEAWHFGYDHTLTRVGVPESDGLDHTYPLRSEYPADHFYELPDDARRWIAALDEDGHGLAQTSTDLLRGRKLFRWGHGRGGRRWQEWLNGPGAAATRRSRPVLPAPSWSTSRWRRAPRSAGWSPTVRCPPTRPPCTAGTGPPPPRRPPHGWRRPSRAARWRRRTRPGCRTPTPNRARCSPSAPAGARWRC